MKKIFISITILALFSFLFSQVYAGEIKGRTIYSGKIPKSKKVKMGADPNCVSKWEGKKAYRSETYSFGKRIKKKKTRRFLGNVYVRVTKGLPKKEWKAPSETLAISQEGCRYAPHVYGFQAGQSYKFLNNDGIKHNVHGFPKANRQFNISMSGSMKETKPTSLKNAEETPFRVKCDIHPWMLSYAMITDHPFFDVTGKNGKYSLPDLPAGTYTVEAWHEKLKTVTKSKITIGADESKTLNITFKK